jgi:protein pelota
MRLIDQDPSAGSMRVQVETDDDIWHLYNVIEVGDLITASTTRRDEKATDKLRAERAEKKRMTLGVRVERIEFSDDDELRMRLLGIIEEGPQDVGQHHTLTVEIGESLRITKNVWRGSHVDRLRRAVFDSVKPKIVFVSLDQDEATIGVLRQFGLKEVANIRSMRSGKRYAEKEQTDSYHDDIVTKLKSIAGGNMPVVLLGPGFEKEVLAQYGKSVCSDIFSAVHVYHTGQSGMAGVNELMKKGIGAQVLRESRVGAEMEAVERMMTEIGRDGLATYGPTEVENAAKAGAVDTLLVLDSKIRERDLDHIIKAVEDQKGSVIIVSGQHDAGRELDALGGLGAILRYRTM